MRFRTCFTLLKFDQYLWTNQNGEFHLWSTLLGELFLLYLQSLGIMFLPPLSISLKVI